MLKNYLRKCAKVLRPDHGKPSVRRGAASRRLVLEHLETRAVPAGLAWSVGASLPLAEAGLAALPQGASLLVVGGPTTASQTLTATDPSWKAVLTPTVQPLDFPRSSPGVGALPNGYYLIFGGARNGYATSAVTQYDPNTPTVPDGTTNQTRSLRAMNAPRARFGWASDTSSFAELRDWRAGQQRHAAGYRRGLQPDCQHLVLPGTPAANALRRVGHR